MWLNLEYCRIIVSWRPLVVSALCLINVVAVRRARLLLGWVNYLSTEPTTQVNSAFHPSGVVKSSRPIPACLAAVKAERVHLCRVAGNTVWSHMVGDARSVVLRCVSYEELFTSFTLFNVWACVVTLYSAVLERAVRWERHMCRLTRLSQRHVPLSSRPFQPVARRSA